MSTPEPPTEAAIDRAITVIEHGAYWDGFNGPTGVTKDECIEMAYEALIAARDRLAALPEAQNPEPGTVVLPVEVYESLLYLASEADHRPVVALTEARCEHDSCSGIDQVEGPEKVWHCHSCGCLGRWVDDRWVTVFALAALPVAPVEHGRERLRPNTVIDHEDVVWVVNSRSHPEGRPLDDEQWNVEPLPPLVTPEPNR